MKFVFQTNILLLNVIIIINLSAIIVEMIIMNVQNVNYKKNVNIVDKYTKMEYNVIIYINLLVIMKKYVINVVDIISHFYVVNMNNNLDNKLHQCVLIVVKIILYINVHVMLVIKHYIIIEWKDNEFNKH